MIRDEGFTAELLPFGEFPFADGTIRLEKEYIKKFSMDIIYEEDVHKLGFSIEYAHALLLGAAHEVQRKKDLVNIRSIMPLIYKFYGELEETEPTERSLDQSHQLHLHNVRFMEFNSVSKLQPLLLCFI